VRLQLAPDWTSARAIDKLRDPRLKYPTTAIATERGLMVVNAQLDKLKDPPPLLPFDIVTLSWPR
jgi:Cu-Zn family superoxide dismutase